jgi:hypothetical protein
MEMQTGIRLTPLGISSAPEGIILKGILSALGPMARFFIHVLFHAWYRFWHSSKSFFMLAFLVIAMTIELTDFIFVAVATLLQGSSNLPYITLINRVYVGRQVTLTIQPSSMTSSKHSSLFNLVRCISSLSVANVKERLFKRQ